MRRRAWWTCACALALTGACTGQEAGQDQAPSDVPDVQGVTDRIATIEGFSGPESVRYDPDQDVWFVGNFAGEGDERDANGFVSRVSAGTDRIDRLRFATGTPAVPLHAPRGMTITGDTLWVVDIDGLHGFDRRTGEQRTFVDLSSFEPGFLNDVAPGPGDALYVTDTGRSAVYRVQGRAVTEALADSTLGSPNGITFDSARNALVLVPWDPGYRVRTWAPGSAHQGFGPRTTPGRMDGVEPFGRRLLVASQTDSALHVMDGGGSRVLVRVDGRPADIAVDTRRWRVAVPYIALNRVDIWALPR